MFRQRINLSAFLILLLKKIILFKLYLFRNENIDFICIFVVPYWQVNYILYA